MIRPILQLGNENLRKKSLPVEDLHDEHLKRVIEDLRDTLNDARRKFGYGRGIAAPQIGELKRIIFVDTPDFKTAMINPRIMGASEEKFEVWDSCFSFSVAFFVLVDRHYGIKVEFFDENGKKRVAEAQDKLSELLQHEIDHLDGILAVDRIKDSRKIIMRSELEKQLKIST
jgi:peptide deformylase